LRKHFPDRSAESNLRLSEESVLMNDAGVDRGEDAVLTVLADKLFVFLGDLESILYKRIKK
jgi:hypothetical protein